MKSKKGLVIGLVIAGVALTAIAGVVLFFILNGGVKKDTYRVIKVQEIDGTTIINRATAADIKAYEGMVLQSGDQVSVDGNSTLILLLDDDKVCYVEENTQLKIIAEGTKESSKTKIELVTGAFTLDVQNKLSDTSSLEVTTPNSTMAIRGTVVRSSVAYTEEGEPISETSLYDGETNLQAIGNVASGKDKFNMVEGDVVTIGGGSDPTKKPVDISDYKTSTLGALQTINKTTHLSCLDGQDLEGKYKQELNRDSFTVTFKYNNKIFATQEVKNGGLISEPKLLPSDKGGWDATLSKPVDRDLTINWDDNKK